MKMETNLFMIKKDKNNKQKLVKMENHSIEMKMEMFKWFLIKINGKLLLMIMEINLY